MLPNLPHFGGHIILINLLIDLLFIPFQISAENIAQICGKNLEELSFNGTFGSLIQMSTYSEQVGLLQKMGFYQTRIFHFLKDTTTKTQRIA